MPEPFEALTALLLDFSQTGVLLTPDEAKTAARAVLVEIEALRELHPSPVVHRVGLAIMVSADGLHLTVNQWDDRMWRQIGIVPLL